NCGLRLDDETLRVAVGLRLGLNLCQPHPCPCGKLVDSRGTHGLACKLSSGRSARHHHINDLIWRALQRAGIPSTKEPGGLSRTDGKRPDGLTLIPWQGGKNLIWDVTVADTLAASHLPNTSRVMGAAAETTADRKDAKYSELARAYTFMPIACETMGPLNAKALDFFTVLGRRIAAVTGDPREGSFLCQRLSINVLIVCVLEAPSLPLPILNCSCPRASLPLILYHPRERRPGEEKNKKIIIITIIIIITNNVAHRSRVIPGKVPILFQRLSIASNALTVST